MPCGLASLHRELTIRQPVEQSNQDSQSLLVRTASVVRVGGSDCSSRRADRGERGRTSMPTGAIGSIIGHRPAPWTGVPVSESVQDRVGDVGWGADANEAVSEGGLGHRNVAHLRQAGVHVIDHSSIRRSIQSARRPGATFLMP